MSHDFIPPRPMTQQERDLWLNCQREWRELVRKEIGERSPAFKKYEGKTDDRQTHKRIAIS